ncbi:flagellar basal body rod protein FlgB [Thiohalorhabdus methylotrophus]|uniref:Flagellar basal body rod protein FlgB n=1 Tax=Thiohalorhabdus methylotrophus TaxID=3242694 RepID=A0ABV4TW10_9GAMM
MLFQSKFAVMGKSLDLHQERLGVIANNIANSDTPGYHAKRLEFDDALRQAFDGGDGKLTPVRTHPEHLGNATSVDNVQPTVREVVQGGRVDGNTVNTQQELERMGETRLVYQMVTQLAGSRAKGLQYAIDKGGR